MVNTNNFKSNQIICLNICPIQISSNQILKLDIDSNLFKCFCFQTLLKFSKFFKYNLFILKIFKYDTNFQLSIKIQIISNQINYYNLIAQINSNKFDLIWFEFSWTISNNLDSCHIASKTYSIQNILLKLFFFQTKLIS